MADMAYMYNLTIFKVYTIFLIKFSMHHYPLIDNLAKLFSIHVHVHTSDIISQFVHYRLCVIVSR